MILGIAQIALLIHDYDEAKAFYCGKLGFEVIEDTQLAHKRWVRLRAAGQGGSEILLSKAEGEKQATTVGNQAGGRVLFFLHTDNFKTDFEKLKSHGVEFSE